MPQPPVPPRAAEGWENEGGSLRPAPDLEALGVTRVLTETFTVGDYRYTNVADAVAQARRAHSPSAPL